MSDGAPGALTDGPIGLDPPERHTGDTRDPCELLDAEPVAQAGGSDLVARDSRGDHLD
jgi:hypothetical protein